MDDKDSLASAFFPAGNIIVVLPGREREDSSQRESSFESTESFESTVSIEYVPRGDVDDPLIDETPERRRVSDPSWALARRKEVAVLAHRLDRDIRAGTFPHASPGS